MIKISATEGVVMIQNTIELDAEQQKLNEDNINRLRAWGKDHHLNIMFVKTTGMIAIGKMLKRDMSDEDLHTEIINLEQDGVKTIDFINKLVRAQFVIENIANSEKKIILNNGFEIDDGDINALVKMHSHTQDAIQNKKANVRSNCYLTVPVSVADEMLELFLGKYFKYDFNWKNEPGCRN